MKKINETYQHEATGMSFEIEHEQLKMGLDFAGNPSLAVFIKKVKIMPSQASGWVRGDKGFVFNGSKPETIKKIGQALLEIGEFCEKL